VQQAEILEHLSGGARRREGMNFISALRSSRCFQVSCWALTTSLMLAPFQSLAQIQDKRHPMEHPTLYRTTQIDMQAIVLAFTTTSYVLGPDGEQAVKARLEKRSNGIPVLTTGAAAVAAFRSLGVRRIALIHPPWFADDDQQLGITYFQKQGFDVVYANQMRLRGFEVAKPTDPLRKFTEVYPAELYAFARAEVPATAEGVFLGGNGFRAIGMIAALEEELGRPVLTGNQVAFWYALRQAGVREPVNGYGRVLSTLHSESK
jgi:maleate cis-trans isomerase